MLPPPAIQRAPLREPPSHPVHQLARPAWQEVFLAWHAQHAFRAFLEGVEPFDQEEEIAQSPQAFDVVGGDELLEPVGHEAAFADDLVAVADRVDPLLHLHAPQRRQADQGFQRPHLLRALGGWGRRRDRFRGVDLRLHLLARGHVGGRGGHAGDDGAGEGVELGDAVLRGGIGGGFGGGDCVFGEGEDGFAGFLGAEGEAEGGAGGEGLGVFSCMLDLYEGIGGSTFCDPSSSSAGRGAAAERRVPRTVTLRAGTNCRSCLSGSYTPT